MEIERRCLSCWYAGEDTTPTQQVALIGQRRFMCLFGPIAASVFPAQGGNLIAIAAYPSINEQTISCGRWTPIPSPEIAALLKKGANDGNP